MASSRISGAAAWPEKRFGIRVENILMSNPKGLIADIVIAGGGTAGCAVAGRLSDAFPDLSIVIVENGPESRHNPLVDRPLPGVFQVYQQPETIKYYKALPNEHMKGAESIVPTGNVLGGGTCVNWLAYQNAAKSDFDDWNMPGWSFDELLPTIRKTTRHEAPGDRSLHGQEGAMPVSLGGYHTRFGKHVEKAFEGTGVPLLEDMADFSTGHGFGRTAKWIGKDGYRSTAARSYLYNRARPNLTILSRKTVIRVLLEDGKAQGVEICDAPPARGDVEVANVMTVRARKQIVICAGALGSPAILERSGIGERSVLERIGVEVKVDLPGVGMEYQDHQNITHGYKIQDLDGLDRFARKEPEALQRAEEQWLEDGTGVYTTSVIDYLFKLRPRAEDLAQMGSAFEEYWKSVGADKPDKPLVTGALGLMYLGDYNAVEPGYYMTIANWLNYSGSRGSIHITDANPHVPPALDTGMLSHPGDIEVHKWAYKFLRDVVRRLPCYLGEEVSKQPSFTPDSPAAVRPVDRPKTLSEPVQYGDADNRAIEQYTRANVKTTWHCMATCPMKGREQGGVVDAKLDVYGVKGLKIADLSICPSNVGSNTASVALIIGEKCAELIEGDLRE